MHKKPRHCLERATEEGRNRPAQAGTQPPVIPAKAGIQAFGELSRAVVYTTHARKAGMTSEGGP